MRKFLSFKDLTHRTKKRVSRGNFESMCMQISRVRETVSRWGLGSVLILTTITRVFCVHPRGRAGWPSRLGLVRFLGPHLSLSVLVCADSKLASCFSSYDIVFVYFWDSSFNLYLIFLDDWLQSLKETYNLNWCAVTSSAWSFCTPTAFVCEEPEF